MLKFALFSIRGFLKKILWTANILRLQMTFSKKVGSPVPTALLLTHSTYKVFKLFLCFGLLRSKAIIQD